MGSWDCYCAICGGPFPSSPRNITFRRRAALKSPSQDQDERSENAEPEEEDFVDADLISESDVAWLCTLHILAASTDESESRVAFVTGPGTYYDSAMVNVEQGDDPNFDENAEILCYDGSFPFHWCCFELLGSALAGKQGVTGIDKFALYCTMMSFSGVCATVLDRVNYGNAAPVNDQWWTEGKGLELTAVHPTIPSADLSAIADLMQGITSGASPPKVLFDLSARVKSDPFSQLPTEILTKVCDYLPVQSVLHLGTASWIVHEAVGNNANFWKSRIKMDMPWAFEIHRLLRSPVNNSEQTIELKLKDWQYKRLYVGLDKATTPRPYLRGPLAQLSLANRRRIWHVCEQIKSKYDH